MYSVCSVFQLIIKCDYRQKEIPFAYIVMPIQEGLKQNQKGMPLMQNGNETTDKPKRKCFPLKTCFSILFGYIRAVKEYATSQVASLLPHFGHRFTHALKTIPVHCRQTFQREALQIDLCCLNRLMPQQLTDNLDRYILFLQERGE